MLDMAFEDEGPAVYPGPDVGSVEEALAFVQENFDLFFDQELDQWCTDPLTWPAPRTYELFSAWFHVRIHSMVLDTVDAPLELE